MRTPECGARLIGLITGEEPIEPPTSLTCHQAEAPEYPMSVAITRVRRIVS